MPSDQSGIMQHKDTSYPALLLSLVLGLLLQAKDEKYQDSVKEAGRDFIPLVILVCGHALRFANKC